MRTKISRMLWSARLAFLLAVGGIAFDGTSSIARGQLAPPLGAPVSTLPEPVYWKQDLFLIPYQFGSAAEPAAAQAVWLFVSKDHGVTWQKISEAKPQVKAFNYRADGEGEYWFAIRTLDHQGRTWPTGVYQPELRVIVDTTIPRIEALRSQILPSGSIEIAWLCSDANLDQNSLVIEAQIDAVDAWQAVPIANWSTTPGAITNSALGSTCSGQVQWQPPPGTRPVAIRATVLDRAKNAATYRSEVTLIAANGIDAPPLSATPNSASAAVSNGIFGAPLGLPAAANASGWVSASAASPPGSALPQAAAMPANQPWPATATGRSPFRLSSVAASTPNDGVTSYGSPPVITAPPVIDAPPPDNGAANLNAEEQRARARHATTQHVVEGGVEQAPTNSPRFAALDPFRQASVKRLPAPHSESSATAPANLPQPPPVGPVDAPQAPPAQTKRVGSRTFALDYDLDDMGRWGVSKVELWGTRDGGRTWHSFARDDDGRSPLVVTVDEEGIYGFRIAVDSAGSAAAAPPNPGDEAELWVSVDLRRPVVELTAIKRGDGNLADHLVFSWQAADDNLEPRPIALFYSSRPTGPWSAIATSLEDTGEYAWRVERHVPARFFVRIEARDTAGNLAAFQTREPVDFAPLSPSGHLRSAEPVGPTAVQFDGAHR
ncbi:MAG: hypothetical protein L0228_00995 [Planctomycetes bacterium]|nr:hypothetical protein [Planctomycetota bacterium]